MSQDIYRNLQERLDYYSLGFPPTESGIELQILKHLFDERDAAMFLELTPMLETPEAVAERTEKPVEEVSRHLEDMAERKLLFRLQKGDTPKYGAVPFVHGLFEFRTKELDKELASLVEQYYEEGFKQAMANGADTFLRVVPIQQSIDATQQVASYEDARDILKNAKRIVVTDCICRNQKESLGKACDKPKEVCFMFGSMAKYYLDYNMGREIDAEEAVDILAKAHEAGLVTQPATSQNPSGMCNCCGDCCGVLASLNELNKPAEMVFSNHYAQIDQDLCTGCEICLDRCQMGALYLNEHGLSEVNTDRCIGCGLCVTTCPTEAVRLIPKPEDKQRVPPANSAEQMMTMAQKRGIQI
mgnify:CR=1 FL=1